MYVLLSHDARILFGLRSGFYYLKEGKTVPRLCQDGTLPPSAAPGLISCMLLTSAAVFGRLNVFFRAATVWRFAVAVVASFVVVYLRIYYERQPQ